MKRVLVAAYGGAHVAAAMPLYRELLAAGLQPVMLGLTTAADTLRRHGIPFVHFLDHVDIGDPAVERWGNFLCEFHHRDGIGITRDESMAYLGASMAERVADVGEEAALASYRARGLNALLPVRTLKRIIEAQQIDAVIATDSPRAERAALNAAVQMGLPSVCLLTSFPHIGLDYLQRSDNGAVICVLNERIRQQLIDAGRQPASVIVTGNPAFDALIAPDAQARRSELRKQAGIPPEQRAVLWAEQPEPGNPDLPIAMREGLAATCASHGWKFIARLHPSSQAGASITLPEGALLSPRTQGVRDALLMCDAVVTFTSTIGFEALVLDKPVVVAAVSQYSHFVDYREDDGVFVVPSMSAVEPALASFFADDEHAQRLARFRRTLPQNGQAARAIVQCLLAQDTTPSFTTATP
ncbi:CDP-glycerol glycerophosphotransferase family protein [Caenimonas sp. SL110]|uniref:CDP-glycerol glycerophosphotransferase family protein n=1 Tax=Caenimonas sp. SL110 TaxID=1450524 RepID=UPI0006529F5E|nr:CDP-glycerol glycerophosphotransferase family protein [Caenimonas sp. SL110]